MNRFDDLIAAATEEDRDAVTALVDGGPDALRAVFATLNEGKATYEPGLFEVIRRSTYPDALPVLRENADAAGSGVVAAVFHALARAGHDGLAFTLERLTDTSAMSTTRAAAAAALNGIDSPGVAEALRETLGEQRGAPDNPEWPVLLVNAAIALATLGDHGGAPALYEHFASDEETGRALAVKAFRIVVDEETFRRLAPLAEDESAEVRAALVDPLFLLGSPAATELLLHMAGGDEDGEVADHAAIRFGNIMGLELSGTGDLDFARDEWETEKDGLDAATCYRFGEPLTLPNLVEEFTEEERLRDDVGHELRFITGVDVPSIYANGGVEAVRAALEGIEIDPGRLYKWGRVRPMPSAP